MVKLIRFLFVCAVILAIAGCGFVGVTIWYFGRDLPDYQQLAHYQPPIMTRVQAGDGRLLAEYAAERRVFVPIQAIPKPVTEAFISAEDKTFYSHHGIDPLSILRAGITDVGRLRGGRRPIGASTITQQVAKNMLLSNEVSVSRKIKEILLATRIDAALSKDRILELYLNEIYLGSGAYGVAAAALTYFDKSLDQLSLGEAAFLGGLPKAPNRYNPVRSPQAATARRDWVLDRMADDGFISRGAAEAAQAEPLVLHHRQEAGAVKAPYFAEEVRRELLARYGEKALYGAGLSVRTSLDPRLQAAADKALRDGLVAYDHGHEGWRGAIAHIDPRGDWITNLSTVAVPAVATDVGWQLAVVLRTAPGEAAIGLANGDTSEIPFSQMRWARPRYRNGSLGPFPRGAGDVVKAGDVVMVAPIAPPAAKSGTDKTTATDKYHGARGGQGGRQNPGRCEGARARRLHPVPGAGSVGRAGRDGSAYRPGAGDQRRVQLCDQPVRPRDPGVSTNRVGDQAVCLSDRARSRLYAVDAGQRRPDLAAAGRRAADVDADQLRGRPLPRPDPAAHRARAVDRYPDGAPRHDGRDGPDRQNDRTLRHHGPCAARIFDHPRLW